VVNFVDEEVPADADTMTRCDQAVEDVEDSRSWLLLLLAATKFVDLVDGKFEGSRPDDKIQSPRSPRSAPIDEG
jgi:hypothetical protein